MKKVLFVFGTRPEAIKMCPLIKRIEKYQDDFTPIVCVTAQHRQMLDQVLDLFEVKPDYDLDIMKSGQDLYDITSRVLIGMRNVIKEVDPHVLLVHGDTSTSMVAALAAFYQQVPVGHVEAGLRTHDIYSPWPEEMNRQLTARMTTYHFSPTPLSRANLIKENVDERNIFVVGNTVIDALHEVLRKIDENKSVEEKINSYLSQNGISLSLIRTWKGNLRRMILITGHRRESFGSGFISICNAIKSLLIKHKDVDFIYPMHLNPNVRKPISQVFGTDYKKDYPNLYLIEPLDYLPFVYLMNLSSVLLTDSGGIQEEAPGLGKPVLVMRDTTERPEAVEAGTVKLVGTDGYKIVKETSALLDDKNAYMKMARSVNPYGDGLSSERILNILKDVLR